MSIFQAFLTPKRLRGHYKTRPCENGVVGLKTLNVICGPNNSGKSMLLRSLMMPQQQQSETFIRGDSPSSEAVKVQAVNITNQLRSHFRNRGRTVALVEQMASTPEPADKLNMLTRVLLGDTSVDSEALLVKQIHELGLDPTGFQAKLTETSIDNNMDAFACVPAIRSCRNLGEQDSIFEHISKRYLKGVLRPQRCYGGQELYDRVRGLLLGKPLQRQQVRNFEDLLSTQSFDGREVSLSPREDGGYGELYVRIEPEPERAVSELGDGLQSIVIQLAPAFLSEGKTLTLFIEEPELYLHPGLQRRLFEVLLDLDQYTHWDRHQVFVTSHSNHLLDLTLDHDRIAVLRVEKTVGERSDNPVSRATAEEDATFLVEKVGAGEIRLLHDLGVQSSSVFLSNCTIWVEGPTDRTILRRYMELVAERDGVELREDLDFSFVYYGGSLAERLSLLDEDGPDVDRMCSRMLFVADGDIEEKADRAERLEATLKAPIHLLKCREIENTVSPEVLRRVIAAWYGNEPERLDLVDGKAIPGAGLGSLIAENYAGPTKEEKWADGDGGLARHRKSRFADMVRDHTESIDDLLPAALAVAEAAVRFVDTQRRTANAPAG